MPATGQLVAMEVSGSVILVAVENLQTLDLSTR